MTQFDLRELAGALEFLDYKAPTADTIPKHIEVNVAFQVLLERLWDKLPDGPGKTFFIRELNRARMSANSCIANEGT
jgi:hypothetical protein